MRAFQAYSNGNFRVTCETPRAAALAFFKQFPEKRKCTIVEGDANDRFFTITYCLLNGKKPQRWENVTKGMAATLPGEAC